MHTKRAARWRHRPVAELVLPTQAALLLRMPLRSTFPLFGIYRGGRGVGGGGQTAGLQALL